MGFFVARILVKGEIVAEKTVQKKAKQVFHIPNVEMWKTCFFEWEPLGETEKRAVRFFSERFAPV